MIGLLVGIGGAATVLSILMTFPQAVLIVVFLGLVALSDVWSSGYREPGTHKEKTNQKKISEITLGDLGDSIGNRIQRSVCRSEIEQCELRIKEIEDFIHTGRINDSAAHALRYHGHIRNEDNLKRLQSTLELEKSRINRLRQEIKRLS